MDRRKNSWDSKVSVSTVSTSGTRRYRRSPSSILSSDSDIRFTRKKLTSQYRFGCCIIASFLCLLLAAAAAVYVGYTFFVPDIPDEQVFRAMFRVVDGDTYTPEMANLNSTIFKIRSRDYKERLNLLFRRSSIKHGYIGSEVLALDGTENKDLIVHFNVRVDPLYTSVDAKTIEAILANEISVEESLFFQNITIDGNSLEVRPTELLLQMTTSTMSTTAISQAITQTPPPPRRCSPLQLPYCAQMPYNITTYPNIFEHKNIKEVKDDVIAFRELVDAECYRHAYDFVCQILQPACKKGDDEDEMILPCRNFCKDFLAGCGGRLSEKFKELLDCNRFPEFGGGKFCFPKPGCVEELKARALSPRICDGVVDCQDLTDEKSCTYCPRNQIHCGIGRVCIHQSRRCDGRTDCPDGSDERGCLSLTPNVETVRKTPTMTPHSPIFHSEGYVMYNERGEIGKLCTESLNRTLRRNKTEEILNTVANSLCKTLSFSQVKNVQIMRDTETNVPYVSMKDPSASEITFIRSSCPTKEVLHISCSNLECGLQSTHGEDGLKTLSKMSSHGDWPWHVALFKEDVHICDGTLVAEDWVVTTTSCFQGQPKAEWSVRLGVIRLTSSSPWEQERRIVGMVKSPVEGSTIALVKLDAPVTLNDFVRPICLPNDNNLFKKKEVQCNTLGWARNREQLQRIQVKQIEMEKCENVSISNVNSFCAETIYGKDDCNEEEFAGSPIVCLNGNRWTLMGLTNWRIACASNGMMRPRMYDKIFSNVEWIKETLSSEEANS